MTLMLLVRAFLSLSVTLPTPAVPPAMLLTRVRRAMMDSAAMVLVVLLVPIRRIVLNVQLLQELVLNAKAPIRLTLMLLVRVFSLLIVILPILTAQHAIRKISA